MRVHINIGSNCGDRRTMIVRAVAAIASSFPEAELHQSSVIETPPWGYESPNPFLNVGLLLIFPDDGYASSQGSEPAAAEQTARCIHACLQAIQHSIDPSPHRDSSGGYIDRRIDIDLIAVDDLVIPASADDACSLVLPHPRMHLRDFVLRPMAMLDPEWLHPLLRLTPSALLARLA